MLVLMSVFILLLRLWCYSRAAMNNSTQYTQTEYLDDNFIVSNAFDIIEMKFYQLKFSFVTFDWLSQKMNEKSENEKLKIKLKSGMEIRFLYLFKFTFAFATLHEIPQIAMKWHSRMDFLSSLFQLKCLFFDTLFILCFIFFSFFWLVNHEIWFMWKKNK